MSPDSHGVSLQSIDGFLFFGAVSFAHLAFLVRDLPGRTKENDRTGAEGIGKMGSEGKSRIRPAKTGHRRFLLLASGALGATALACDGLTAAGTQQPHIDLVDPTYGGAHTVKDRILVAYASQAGSTSGVAEALGKQLTAGGVTVDVRQVKEVTDLSAYRAVVVGSAIHGGKWLPEAIKFVEANQRQLSQMPTAIFLVCLTLAKDSEEYRRQVPTWLEPARTLVRPVAEGVFAGALWFKNHPFITEGLGMRIFAATLGVGEGDYRNWKAIRAWADSARPLLLR